MAENLKNKVIITAALVGNQTMKENNPNVPYSPEEYAEEAKKCQEAGAAIFHLHIRDPKTGQSSHDLNIIRPTLEAIKKVAPNVIINISSSISPLANLQERIAPLIEFQPEMCSLNSNSMNFASADYHKQRITSDFLFENTFHTIKKIANTASKFSIKPEIEIYDLGGLYNILFLAKTDLLVHPLHFQFVFGVLGGVPLTLMNLAHFLQLLPPDATWSTCGVAKFQFQGALIALTQGGHIRVGLEDNIRNYKQEIAKGSYEQVEWAAKVIELAGKEVATPDEARLILNLRPKTV